VTADDGDGIPEPNTAGDQIGLLGLVVSNAVDPEGLSGATADLFGAPIRDAAFRVDKIRASTRHGAMPRARRRSISIRCRTTISSAARRSRSARKSSR
jgi:hypothetical protein